MKTITNTKQRKVRIAVGTDEGGVRIELREYQGEIFDDLRRSWSTDVMWLTMDELRAIVRQLDVAK
jgi:hypothetical protein